MGSIQTTCSTVWLRGEGRIWREICIRTITLTVNYALIRVEVSRQGELDFLYAGHLSVILWDIDGNDAE